MLAGTAGLLLAAAMAWGQAAPATEPDTLVFANGEKLVGHLVRSNGGSLTFHSDTLGDVTVDWAKVAQLTSARRFVVIPKGFEFKRNEADGRLTRGTISATGQSIQVNPGGGQPAQTVAVGDAGHMIDEPGFENASKNPGFLSDWKGALNGGITLVQATQTSRTYSSAVHLVRAIPVEDWLAPRDRTLVNFNAAYGKVDQPNTPTVKTSIYHLDAEHDRYFTSRLYGFGQAAFDHNFSQGLDLQQAYGGGIGWTVIKTPLQTLDLKASLSYISQRFQTSDQNKNLIGSIFGETYQRRLPFGMIFDEQILATPAWNNSSAYTVSGSAGLTFPVYKRLGLNVNTLDTFLNDPPPGFKKNSFQFTTGVTYTLP